MKTSPLRSLSLALAISAATAAVSCSPRPQSLGTAPSTPVSSITSLSDTSASNPDPGVSHKPVKIDTGIDPYADRKRNN